MGVVPVLAGCSMYLGIWYMSTRVGTDELSQTVAEADSLKSTGDYDGAEIALKRVTSKRGSTARIDSAYKPRRGLPMRWHHLQRGVMQLYLFTFAPVTRRCAELLICREVTHRGVTEVLLVSDLSVTCWSGPHFVAAIISVAILSVYAIVLPSYLLMRTRKYLLTRDHEKPVEQRDLREPSCCDPRTFLSAQRLDRDVDPEILSRMKATPTLNPKCWVSVRLRALSQCLKACSSKGIP